MMPFIKPFIKPLNILGQIIIYTLKKFGDKFYTKLYYTCLVYLSIKHSRDHCNSKFKINFNEFLLFIPISKIPDLLPTLKIYEPCKLSVLNIYILFH